MRSRRVLGVPAHLLHVVCCLVLCSHVVFTAAAAGGGKGSAYHPMAWAAARSSNVHLLAKALEDEPAMLNAQEPKTKQTLLMAAVLAGQPRAVKLLLDAGADASVGEMQGYTVFHGAGFQVGAVRSFFVC